MHVDFDRAGQGRGRRVVDVGAAPATVPVGGVSRGVGMGRGESGVGGGGGGGGPEVRGGVFVRDEEDREGGVGGGGEDRVCGRGVVLARVGG